MASTADSTEPWAVIMITGSVASCSFSACVVWMPSMPGIMRSTIAQS